MKLIVYSLSLLLLLNSCATITENKKEILIGSCAIVGLVAGTAYGVKNDDDSDPSLRSTMTIGFAFGAGVGYGLDWLFFKNKDKDENYKVEGSWPLEKPKKSK